MKQPLISVLIVTKNRVALLGEALASLKAAANRCAGAAHFEFIVVVNGTDPLTKEQLSKHHADIVVVTLDGSNPGAARNEGLLSSNGDWIYFADDDIAVRPDFFEKFLQIERAYPGCSVIGGPNLTPGNSNRFQRASGAALGSRFASFRCADRYRKSETDENCDDSKLILCNLFVRREVAVKSPFPKTFVCAEENFALGRWKTEGARFLYSPELGVDHRRRESAYSFFKQVVKYGRGRGRLVRIGEFKWFHVLPSLCLIACTGLVIEAAMGFLSPAPVCALSGIYFFLVTAEAVRVREQDSPVHLALTALSICLIHIGYSCGVIFGAVYDHKASPEIFAVAKTRSASAQND